MKRIRNIIIVMFVIILLFNNNIYAKYKYSFEKIICLTRDNLPPEFDIVYSETNWTNKDVQITVNLNKKIEILENDGWELLDQDKTATKTLSENGSSILKVEDISGNIIDIPYEISNIDKEFPQIAGIKDKEIYFSDVELEYIDNIGIESVVINRYSYMNFSYVINCFDIENSNTDDIDSFSITVNVIDSMKEAEYYKYYINEDLYEITDILEYTFPNLQLNQIVNVRIEAVDEEENIIETVMKDIKIEETEKKDIEDIFDSDEIIYDENEEIDINKLTKRGKYEIIVTDLAKNATECIIYIETNRF